jgi:hypothetical protein
MKYSSKEAFELEGLMPAPIKNNKKIGTDIITAITEIEFEIGPSVFGFIKRALTNGITGVYTPNITG